MVFNWSSKNFRSAWGTFDDRSSTYEKRCVMLPYPSSPLSPLASRCLARCRYCLLIGSMMQFMTIEEKIAEGGHPWLHPSFMLIFFQVVLFHLKWTVPGSSYMSVVRGVSSGKFVSMMLNSSSRDTLLNMFVRSANTAARVGRLFCVCGVIMCFSIDNCIAFMMKSIPPLMPMA